jgi:guanylate kinase
MSLVVVVSGASGSGKSTLVGRLLKAHPELMFSVSHTTRPPRGGERQDESYHYVSREEFEERIAGGEFLEWAEVFGNYYGTHRSEVERARAQGRDLVLDIDVQGARQLKSKIPDAVSIFVLAPSREVLEKRLRARSEDSEEAIAPRLREAAREIEQSEAYDYVVINREIEPAVETLAAIIEAERVRRTRMEEEVRPILETFREDSEGV